MPDSPEKIKWHPAFYAAAELELKTNINELQFIPEYSLSKEPIRIDLLIMKNKEKQTSINNEIGHIMKTYNISFQRSISKKNDKKTTACRSTYKRTISRNILCNGQYTCVCTDYSNKQVIS